MGLFATLAWYIAIITGGFLSIPVIIYFLPRRIKRIVIRPILTKLTDIQSKNATVKTLNSSRPTAAEWTSHIINPTSGLITIVPDHLWMVTSRIRHGESSLPRNMFIYRPAQSKYLLIHSAVCSDETTMSLIDGLGTVELLLVPCAWHRMDIELWKRRYPNAKVICPTASKILVQQEIMVDAVVEDIFPLYSSPTQSSASSQSSSRSWSGVRRIEPIGFIIPYQENAYFLPIVQKTASNKSTPGAVLLFNDLLSNISPSSPQSKNIVMKILGSCVGLNVAAVARVLAIHNDADAAQWFNWLANTVVLEDNVSALVMSHGEPVLERDNINAGLKIVAENLFNDTF